MVWEITRNPDCIVLVHTEYVWEPFNIDMRLVVFLAMIFEIDLSIDGRTTCRVVAALSRCYHVAVSFVIYPLSVNEQWTFGRPSFIGCCPAFIGCHPASAVLCCRQFSRFVLADWGHCVFGISLLFYVISSTFISSTLSYPALYRIQHLCRVEHSVISRLVVSKSNLDLSPTPIISVQIGAPFVLVSHFVLIFEYF